MDLAGDIFVDLREQIFHEKHFIKVGGGGAGDIFVDLTTLAAATVLSQLTDLHRGHLSPPTNGLTQVMVKCGRSGLFVLSPSFACTCHHHHHLCHHQAKSCFFVLFREVLMVNF